MYKRQGLRKDNIWKLYPDNSPGRKLLLVQFKTKLKYYNNTDCRIRHTNASGIFPVFYHEMATVGNVKQKSLSKLKTTLKSPFEKFFEDRKNVGIIVLYLTDTTLEEGNINVDELRYMF